MSLIPSLSLLTGEALLSLYPVLIKSVDVGLLPQTLIRLITTSIVCYPFTSISAINVLTDLSHHIVSFIYVIHILASYVGFRDLDVGVAITLFYTYPIINVLINGLFITKIIDFHIIYYFLLSFLGVILISHDGSLLQSKHLIFGVIAMIISAISESLIYIFHKTNHDTNPYNMLFSLCLSGSILLGIYYLYEKITVTNTTKDNFGIFVKIATANIIFGVIGYILRFYSIHKITTEWFSILSFIGIIYGYLYGWVFYREKINTSKILGTLLIVFCAYRIKSYGY